MVNVSGVAEIVLMVGDIEKSRRFYTEILGLEAISPDLGGPVFLRAGPERAGVPSQVVLVPRPAAAPPLPAEGWQRNVHHFGLEIPQGTLAQTKQALEAKGLQVRTGEHPFLSVEAIYIDDPDGNEVELVATR